LARKQEIGRSAGGRQKGGTQTTNKTKLHEKKKREETINELDDGDGDLFDVSAGKRHAQLGRGWAKLVKRDEKA